MKSTHLQNSTGSALGSALGNQMGWYMYSVRTFGN